MGALSVGAREPECHPRSDSSFWSEWQSARPVLGVMGPGFAVREGLPRIRARVLPSCSFSEVSVGLGCRLVNNSQVRSLGIRTRRCQTSLTLRRVARPSGMSLSCSWIATCALGGGGRSLCGLPDRIHQGEQIIALRGRRFAGNLQAQHLPTAWGGQAPGVVGAQIIGVRFRVDRQRAQDRGGIRVHVGQGCDRCLRAGRTRALSNGNHASSVPPRSRIAAQDIIHMPGCCPVR